MIQEKAIISFEELIDELEKLEANLGDKADNLLFRGQSDSAWLLETTMERNLKLPVSLKDYYNFAYTAKTRLETFTGKEWKIPTPPEYEKWLNEKDALDIYPFPGYEFIAYLRHHGFPSPLLDWTASPYIAMFFAFNGCDRKCQSIAIYGFLEYASVAKLRSNDEPSIYKLGPYANIHHRHVLQQSQYTVCIELDKEYNAIYSNHELVFPNSSARQDRLWKFTVPTSEKDKALKKLNKMNINAYSLFGSVDSLVETISNNEIIRKNL